MNDFIEDRLIYFRGILPQFRFSVKSPIALAPPKKGYTARSFVNVTHKVAGNVSEMCMVVLGVGDGTGDESTFKERDLNIPEEYRFREKQWKVFPRDKREQGVVTEAMFPIGTISSRFGVCDHLVSLEELATTQTGDGKKTIQKMGDLGDWREVYMGLIGHKLQNPSNEVNRPFRVYLTTGYRRDGIGFGDFHAIHFRRSGGFDDIFQIVGFLATTEKGGVLNDYFDKVGLVASE